MERLYNSNNNVVNKCGICFLKENNLKSILESDGYNTYAYMITSISNVKIVHDDKNKICLSCIIRLKNAYDFKVLLESSYNKQEQQLKQNLRHICFSNIWDIHLGIKFNKHKTKRKDNFEIIMDGNDSMTYNEVIIKKYEINGSKDRSSFPLPEFDSTIKEESTNQYDSIVAEDHYQSDLDEPKIEQNSLRKVNYTKKSKSLGLKNDKKGNFRNCNGNYKTVHIKPVFMEDLCLIRSKMKKYKQKKVYYKKLKEEICPYCGKISKTMKKHLLVHGEGNFKCDECSQAFYTEASLTYHKKKHLNIKTFKCDNCVASFNNKTALQSHLLSHMDVRKHFCNICNKPFKRKGSMIRHKLIHNSANKCIKCEKCNMSFFTKCGLKHHMRVHTGERPFICEICSQPYSYKHDFNRHCLNKHGVFLKRRAVYVMNNEVLTREKALMRDLMLRFHGIVKDGEPFNPFENEGPQGAMAFEQAMKALHTRKIPVDL